MYYDVQKLVDIDLFSDIRRIEDALNRKSCTEALAWCSENKAALRKLKVITSTFGDWFNSLTCNRTPPEYSRIRS